MPIYFQRVTAGAYDPETGDYGSDTVTEVPRYAAVMDTRTETMQLVYGEIRQCIFRTTIPIPLTTSALERSATGSIFADGCG